MMNLNNNKDIIISHKFSNKMNTRNKIYSIRQAKLSKQGKNILPIQ
jgi:hypothetical protein